MQQLQIQNQNLTRARDELLEYTNPSPYGMDDHRELANRVRSLNARAKLHDALDTAKSRYDALPLHEKTVATDDFRDHVLAAMGPVGENDVTQNLLDSLRSHFDQHASAVRAAISKKYEI